METRVAGRKRKESGDSGSSESERESEAEAPKGEGRRARRPSQSPDRLLPTPGDDVGAAELGRRVAENLRHKRKLRAMSLDDLAKASGVSRAALSQVETCKTNPTVGLLWKIAVGLGVPFADLLGQPKSGISVLRRGDAQVLRSVDGKLESRPLSPAGASALVEIYELRLAARSTHSSEPHASGTHEFLTVLSGSLRLHVDDEILELMAGDTVSFPADRTHAYENPAGSEARYHNVILYER
jgi:XRE family transcriptional regulator, regulator of sulfur utilization